jgi:hypothetical protein
VSKPKNKAMKRNGTKSRWSDKSALPNAVHAVNLRETVPHEVQVRMLQDIAREEAALAELERRRADRHADGLLIEGKDSKVYRKLSAQAMNAASMREQLPTDSGTFARQIAKQAAERLKSATKHITYRTLFIRNGEGYKDAMVFASDCAGFWYCEYDCERGSFVSVQRFTDKELFRFERENNIINMRPVTIRERHFIIASNTRV